jgi:hypothetical protein
LKRRFHSLHSEIRLKLTHVPAYLITAAVLHNIAVRGKLPHFDTPADAFPDEQPPTIEENQMPGAGGNFATRTFLTENFFNQNRDK